MGLLFQRRREAPATLELSRRVLNMPHVDTVVVLPPPHAYLP